MAVETADLATAEDDMRSIVTAAVGGTLIVAVRGYQYLLSPWLGPCCRYQPTCSQYFILAVQKYGAWRGSWRGLRRIGRCHPWGRSGFDPP